MNRSILIVICDFLLVTLLAFSTVDINKTTNEGVPRTPKMDLNAKAPVDTGKDLTAVMRMALNEERKEHERLLGELSQTRETAEQRAAALSEREKQTQAFQQQLAVAQTNIQSLNERLQSTSAQSALSSEKLAALEAAARREAEQNAALQQQLARLAATNQAVAAEKQQLATRLQVAEVEQRHATEQAARMREEVKVEREEKAKLAEGVKALASRSSELAQEVRENRSLAPNTIFNEFVTNRVQVNLTGVRAGFFGQDSTKTRETATVLVTDGTNVFALCHVQDTPLTLGEPGTDWGSLSGTLSGRAAAPVEVRSLSFFFEDPRIVWVPVTREEVRALGSKVYRLASDPFKFQDAVVVGARESYYGECKFQIDLTTPEYLKMDHNSLKGLFGKFNPSRGDLVFSRTGDLLGIMANSTYCLMLHNFDATATIEFGKDVRAQRTGDTLSRLYASVYSLPTKLQ